MRCICDRECEGAERSRSGAVAVVDVSVDVAVASNAVVCEAYPTMQWCTSWYISAQTEMSGYMPDRSAKWSSVKTTEPLVEFSNGTTP